MIRTIHLRVFMFSMAGLFGVNSTPAIAQSDRSAQSAKARAAAVDRAHTVHLPDRGGPAPSESDRLDQWTVGAAHPVVDTQYVLTNLDKGASLIKNNTASSGPLIWGAGNEQEWEFRRTPASNYLAIYNPRTGAYLTAPRVFSYSVVLWTGANGAYQWDLKATVDNRIALFNAVKQDYLVHDETKPGYGYVNWRFHPVPLPPPPPAPATYDASVTMNAQPPVQGYVPFLGRFPGIGINTGNLVQVANPQAFNTPLWFVLPQHSSTQCGQSDATTYLAPGAVLTSDQMTKLWGSPKPSLKNGGLTFLACAATDKSSVRVNIKWQKP